MSKSLKIVSFKISNVLHAEELEVSPGKVTVFEGKNERGKTSALNALRFFFKGGTDATLLRKGAEKGEGVLLFDDGVQVDKSVTESGTTLKVTHPELGRISSPQTYLNGLVDYIGVNPMKLIHAEPADRAKIVMEAMPLTVERAALEEAVGPLVDLPPGIEQGHALSALASAHKLVYDERTFINREVKNASATVNDLLPTVNSQAPDAFDIETAIETINQEKVAVERRRNAMKLKADKETQKVDEEIAVLQARKAAIASDKYAQNAEFDANIVRLDADLKVENERKKSIEGLESARKMVKTKEADIAEGQARSQALTGALERLDAIKSTLVKELPIDIVFGDDGEIYNHEGVPFSGINTAQQMIIAMEVSALRSKDKKLKLICVDNLEALDEDNFGRVVEWVNSRDDLQLVGARVTKDTELTVSIPQ